MTKRLLQLQVKNISFFCAILLALASCATTYKPLSTPALNFQNKSAAKDKLEVSYLYDVQALSNNKRYSKKERKFGFAAIGLKITNTSDQPITLTRQNFKILANGSERPSVTVTEYTGKVKQLSGLFLLHALWGPWAYTYEENSATGVSKSSFKYIPVGAIVGLINALVAGSANKNHLTAMQQNEIYGKAIEPGKTLHGVAIVQMLSYEPLTFDWKE